jgi:hypothetical protein
MCPPLFSPLWLFIRGVGVGVVGEVMPCDAILEVPREVQSRRAGGERSVICGIVVLLVVMVVWMACHRV